MSAPTSRNEGMRRLTEVSRALTYARTLDAVLELTVDCATDLLAADQAILMLSDDEGLLHIRAARGIDPDVVSRFSEPLDENLLKRLTAVVGPDARERFLGVPLVVRGGVIGLLGIRHSDDPADHEEAEWLLSALADQAAVALESTRHQEVHDQLAGRVEQLQRSDRQREHALEILGHDLRSPLNAVLGYTALLSGEVLGPINVRQKDALDRLTRVASHLESIVSHVLDMSRLSNDRVETRLVEADLCAVVDQALEIVAPAATEAGIPIQVTGPDTILTRTDPDHVRQVLIHLLDNAVKYSPAGTVIVVALREVHAGGSAWVEVDVKDDGPGVALDLQETMFEPYVRHGGATPRAQSGVGLGLAIASSLVKRLGGMLTVESTPGEGARFTVRLPVLHS